MNKEFPCHMISDLLPLYQDDLVSEQTRKDIDQHVNECKDCKKKMDAMKMQMDIQSANVEMKTDPLKKVRFYQRMLIALGAVIASVLGACYPIVVLGVAVLKRGEIAAYQIERIKNLWYVFALRSCVAGIIVCAVYFLIVLLIRKKISKNAV